MTEQELKELRNEINDYFVNTYMDLDNGNNLEVKERVLKALKAGKKPPEIPEYDDALDLWVEEEPDLGSIDWTNL